MLIVATFIIINATIPTIKNRLETIRLIIVIRSVSYLIPSDAINIIKENKKATLVDAI